MNGVSGSRVKKYLSSPVPFVRLKPGRRGPLVSSRKTGVLEVRSTQVKFLRLCASCRLKIVGQVKIVIGCVAWEVAVIEIVGASEQPGTKFGGSMAILMAISGGEGGFISMVEQRTATTMEIRVLVLWNMQGSVKSRQPGSVCLMTPYIS